MLHIVQVVMWGVAETPQLFSDEAEARTAYVASAKKFWEQRYAAYCEHHGVGSDGFAAAQAFVETIDASEKSRINYWSINPEEAGAGDAQNRLGGPRVEEIRDIVNGISAVKEGLTQLLDDVSDLAARCARMDLSPAGAQSPAGPETAAYCPAATTQEEPEADPATYATPEWKAFVGTMSRLCGGPRNEFYLLPRDSWRQDIYSDRTALEYLDWVADRIVKYKEKAKSAHYSVVETPDSPGCYRFVDRKGIASEECCNTEWEAWCAAGVHLEDTCRNPGT